MAISLPLALTVALAQLPTVTTATGGIKPTLSYLSTATVLPDGRVLLTGGYSFSTGSNVPDTWLFNPLTGDYDAGVPLPEPRAVHSALRLASGDVLVAGGGSSRAVRYVFATGQWVNAGVLPGGDRSDAQLVRLADGTAMYLGGRDDATVGQTSVDVFAPTANAWSTGPPLPVPNNRSCTLVLEDGGLVLLGGGAALSDAANGVVLYTGGGFVATGALAGPRADLTCLRQPGDSATLFGGTAGDGGLVGRVENISLGSAAPGDWPPMPDPAMDVAFGLLLSGRVVLGGGGGPSVSVFSTDAGWVTQTSPTMNLTLANAVALPTGRMMVNGGYSGSLTMIDERVDNTSTATSMPLAVARFASQRLPDGRLLALGGDTGAGTPTQTVSAYNETSDSWAYNGELTVARIGGAAALLLDGRILVAGGTGADNAVLDNIELYDPQTGHSTDGGQLLTARTGASAVTLGDGRVLLLAGTSATDAGVDGVELYDPSTGGVQPSGSLASPTSGMVALRLRDGRVFIAGGESNKGELWAPDGSVSDFGSVFGSGGRSRPTVVLLPGACEVLVAGGYDTTGTAVADAWRFNLRTQTSRRVADLPNATGAPGVVLRSGEVVLPFGEGVPSLQTYDPISDHWQATGTPVGLTAANTDTIAAVGLSSGRALFFGGIRAGAPIATSFLYQEEGPIGLPRPDATPLVGAASPGDTVAFTGANLLAPAHIGGATTEQTSWDEVVFALEALEGQDYRFIESHAQSASSALAVLPADLQLGWYQVRPTLHGVSGSARSLFIGAPFGGGCTFDGQCVTRACLAGACVPMPDAGTPDAGTPDAATSDAAGDGGSRSPSEAGADGGVSVGPDGGAAESGRYLAGCGCTELGPAPLLIAALLILRALRRSRPASQAERKRKGDRASCKADPSP